jgi:hypothetical protein
VIRRLIARFTHWTHTATLRADIAGYEHDLASLRLAGHRGTASERMIIKIINDLKHELYLATRKADAAITN